MSQETIKQNSDGSKNIEEVPKHALTMGIKTIMSSKKILVFANGPRKAKAVKDSLEGPITTSIPASILQSHKDVIWFLDSEAASKLTLRTNEKYY